MDTFFDLLIARREHLLEAKRQLEALQNRIGDPHSEDAGLVQVQLDTLRSQIADINDEIDQTIGTSVASQPADEQQLAKIRAATGALHQFNTASAAIHDSFEQIVSLMEEAG